MTQTGTKIRQKQEGERQHDDARMHPPQTERRRQDAFGHPHFCGGGETEIDEIHDDREPDSGVSTLPRLEASMARMNTMSGKAIRQ